MLSEEEWQHSYHREEYTAEKIAAYFSIDLAPDP